MSVSSVLVSEHIMCEGDVCISPHKPAEPHRLPIRPIFINNHMTERLRFPFFDFESDAWKENHETPEQFQERIAQIAARRAPERKRRRVVHEKKRLVTPLELAFKKILSVEDNLISFCKQVCFSFFIYIFN